MDARKQVGYHMVRILMGTLKEKDALSVWESWDFKCGCYYICTTTFRHGNGERKAFDCTLFPVRQ
jgi:hypothetical protein